MGLFDKKIKNTVSQKDIDNARLRQQNQTLKLMAKFTDKITKQMSSHRTFPEEFYTDGNGVNAIFNTNNSKARRLSRLAMAGSTTAQSLVNTINVLSVGSGLTLEAQPVWRLIPENWTPEKRSEWAKDVEARYNLWAKRKSISYTNDLNRYQQEQQIFADLLVDGEYFELYRYSTNSNKNPLTIQIVRPEDVRTPSGSTVTSGNIESQGIEYNSKGEAVAYHIWNYNTLQTVRISRFGARSGRVLVNHVKLGSNRRGVGIVASMTQELVKLSDYENLEVQAAVINALYAVWMKTPEKGDSIPTLNGGIRGNAQATATLKEAEDWQSNNDNIDYSNGGVQVDNLPPGYEMQSFDTKRPNVNFGVFMDQVKKNLSASKGIPLSVLDKKFESNYSASRGELILAWYEIEKYRYNQSFTNDLVYKMWIWGEVLNGKIEAPSFFKDEDTMDSWCGAKWIGNQRPDIDPLKSVKAHILEQDRAYKTGKQITAERSGGDYDENLERVKGELVKVAENQAPLINNVPKGDGNLGDN